MASPQPTSGLRLPPFPPWLPAAACALAGFAVFQFWGNATRGYIATRSVFWWWGYQWFNPASESEHGLLVLVLAAWLLWRNLEGKSKSQRPSSKDPEDGAGENARAGRAALAAMVGGLELHLLGYAVQQTRLSIVALLIFAWGVSVLAGGRRWGRAAVFPLAFMVFAIPVDVLDTLGFYLRLGVAGVAYGAARAVGLDVVRNGTQLFSAHGGYQYDVAAACSGVRSLMALAALSLLVGYLSLRTWRARLLVLGLCVPYAFAGNVVRIVAIILSAEWFGQRAGMIVHEWFGFLVFAIVLALQLVSVRLLKRWRPEAEPGSCRSELPPSLEAMADRCSRPVLRRPGEGGCRGNIACEQAPTLPASCRPASPFPPAGFRASPWSVMAAVLVVAVFVAVAADRLDTLQAGPAVGIVMAASGQDPVELPSFLTGGWMGQDVPVSAAERAVLPPDTGYSRKNYVWLHDSSRQVFVSIVLSGRDRTSIHRPELCLLGQGWTIDGRSGHDFAYPGSRQGTVPATVLRVRREVLLPSGGRMAVPSLVAYWFVGHDRVVASHWARMWWSAVDRLCRLRTNRWAYVLVQTTAFDGETAALARLQTVLDQTLPAFEKPPPADS
jgi:exosortase